MDEFWGLSVTETNYVIEGHRVRMLDGWRQTRLLYTLLYNVNVKKGHTKRAEELLPLPDDHKETGGRKVDVGKVLHEAWKSGTQEIIDMVKRKRHGS